MDKKIVVLLVVLFLVTGFVIGRVFEKGACQSELAQLDEETNWMKSELEMIYPPLPQEIYSLSGNVMEVGGDFLIIEADVRVNQFPLPGKKQFEKQNIKVKVIDETEIFRTEFLDIFMFDDPEGTGTAQDPFQRTTLAFSDIEAGSFVFITSEENIKDKKEVIASRIELRY
jgi:hypothetical protein